MEQGKLWVEADVASEVKEAAPMIETAARWVGADRSQVCLRPLDLDSLIAEDHPARLLWQAVERLDLNKFYDAIKARENRPGRTPTDPKVLLVLWLYATSEGEGSARRIERLTQEHRAYRWIRGEVPLNHHMLSDFRWQRAEAMDELLTHLLGVLMHQGLLKLGQVAQDGLRVRASAGSGSFRRRKKLKECVAMARQRVQALKEQSTEEAAQRSAAQRAAQERAANERNQRLEQALKELDAIEAHREKVKKAGGWTPKKEARVSWSDGQARVMKMANGGFRPGYNVQLASASTFVVGVDVTNEGTDGAQAVPMLEQIERRTGERPKQGLYDAAYSNKETIDELEKRGVEMFAAAQKRGEHDPYEVVSSDSPAVAQWRRRMAGDEGKSIYKKRSEHELVNAKVRTWQSLDRMLVRGIDKVLAVAVLNALTYDLVRWISLGMGS